MAEVPVAGENHRHACGVGGGDDLGVVFGTSGLDAGGRGPARCGRDP
ncbi:MAG: hypothetical protein RLZZ522_424 [Verrucomicrobiota bacterium]